MSEASKEPRQLKNLLILPGFQLKLMSYFIGLFLVTTLCLYSTTFLFFWRLKEKGLKVGIPEGHVFFKFLANQKADLDTLFIALAGINFMLLVGIGFIISHRIAGPLFKLKRHLRELDAASNNYKLREHDFFRELEPIVNDLKDKLK